MFLKPATSVVRSTPAKPFRSADRGSHSTAGLWQRIVTLIVGLAIVGGGVLGFASAASAADDDNKDTLSLYAVSSNVAGWLMNETGPKKVNDETDGPFEAAGKLRADSPWYSTLNSPATAGAALGYMDKNFNVFEWLVSQATVSTITMDYKTVQKTFGPAARQYAEYGATIQAMGLDTTQTGLAADLLPWFGGAVLLLPFWMTAAVNWFFNLLLTMLSWLNPFKWFYDGVEAVAPKFVSALESNGGEPDLGALNGVAGFVSSIYKAVSELSWAVIVPLFVAVALMMLIFGKQGSRGGILKKLIVRVMFIIVGIPLLGSMYTGTLDSMISATSGYNSGAARVVASTFVDFDTWATEYRLAVPEGATIEWNRKSQQPSADSMVNVSDTALAINKMTHSEWSSLESAFNINGEVNWGDVASGDAEDDESSDDAHLSAADMIVRYMNSEKTESGSFAGAVQSASKNQDDFKKLRDSDPQDYEASSNPLLKASGDGELTASKEGDIVTFTSGQNKCGASLSKGDCALSPLATYNYLTTSFGSKDLTIYGSGNAGSAATLKVHNQVSLIGNGFGGLVYWFNAVVLLVSFVVIGFGYAIAMLAGNVRNGLKMVAGVPFAMMGALGAVTKVIVFTFVMILEAIVTVFLYQIVQQLLLAFPKLFSDLMSQFLNFGGGTAVGTGVLVIASAMGPTIMMVISIAISLLIIALTIMAMRMRKTVVKALSDAATKIVETLTGGSHGQGGGSSALGAVVGGAAAGAGMALGGKIMGGSTPAGPAPAGVGPQGAGASGTLDATAEGGDGSTDGGGSTGSGPDGGGPSGVGGGGGIAVTGGEGGAGADGEAETAGGSGGGMGASSSDVVLGATVAKNGLTMNPAVADQPSQGAGSTGGVGGTADTSTTQAKSVQGGGDAMDSLESSVDEANAQQKELSAQKRKALTGKVEAGAHVGLGVARGAAGDYAGAASEGMQAGKSLKGAQNSQAAAKQTQRRLDTPSSTPQQRSSTASTPARQSGSAPARPAAGGKAPARTPHSAPAPRQGPSSSAPRPAPAARNAASPSPTPPSSQRRSARGSAPKTPKRTLPIPEQAVNVD